MNKDIVLIEWFDSSAGGKWEFFNGLEPLLPCLCYSVGFMIEDNPNYKTIALGICDTQVLDRMTIPGGCIKSIKKLREEV